MKYISTRGDANVLDFEDVVIAGLAPDGGLYVPQEYPSFTSKQIKDMANLSYTDLVFTVIKPYVGGVIDDTKLQSLIEESYKDFRHEEVAPLEMIDELRGEYVLELFHGPTMAFKDFALQLLGRLFEYVLAKRGENVLIVGATSGDTGSAAIEGCRHSDHVKMFIMHPHNRISQVQRMQMTTILADNVHNIALQGAFDDCQDMVKALFNDQRFLEGKSRLVAVNSINWCRIMAQIVYYFYAALKLGGPDREVSFSVPTGNFGDIFAGYIARKMGLPIKQLVVATNANDILDRFVSHNDYSIGTLVQTLSPSMDIQIASNFERLLFDIHDCDGKVVKHMLQTFRQKGLTIEQERFAKVKEVFASMSVDDDATGDMIKHIFDKTNMLIDPHTATAVVAARKCRQADRSGPMVVLATAHPAKFPAAVAKAGLDAPQLPEHFSGLLGRPERFDVLANDIGVIEEYIVGHAFS